MTLIKYTN